MTTPNRPTHRPDSRGRDSYRDALDQKVSADVRPDATAPIPVVAVTGTSLASTVTEAPSETSGMARRHQKPWGQRIAHQTLLPLSEPTPAMDALRAQLSA